MDGGQWMKAADHQTLAPVWVPLFDALAEQLTDMLREGRGPRLLPPSGHAPIPALPEGKLDFATHFPLLTPFRVPPARWAAGGGLSGVGN